MYAVLTGGAQASHSLPVSPPSLPVSQMDSSSWSQTHSPRAGVANMWLKLLIPQGGSQPM